MVKTTKIESNGNIQADENLIERVDFVAALPRTYTLVRWLSFTPHIFYQFHNISHGIHPHPPPHIHVHVNI